MTTKSKTRKAPAARDTLAALLALASPAIAGDSPMIGDTAAITVGWPGCKSEVVFDQFNSIAKSGDTTAFLKFSFDNRATGECAVFPAGLKVRIENISQQHLCVRPEGQEAIADMKRQEAEIAKRVADLKAEDEELSHQEPANRDDTCFWIETDHAQGWVKK